MTKDLEASREEMVEQQLIARGVVDPQVLAAMRKIPRHLFVHEEMRSAAYLDGPLPIGARQTISQPFIVAYMTEFLGLMKTDNVLEIGTGSGYQTAVLAEIAAEVWTVEIIPSLAASARRTLETLGYGNIRFKVGDGSGGWPEEAPFDAIIVTAAPADIPAALKDQLRDGGRMIVPVGRGDQRLKLIRRLGDRMIETHLLSVRFVPLMDAAPKENP
ncbi:MAG: protein-L-isoaspartate(D-aspartate) O-methyltransferase [Candidatus Aminicenantes bacterium]|nr:protein-L-isoaspartate(D-aspartate) O-methyltransferase [Candidatus Aminicenantes bacterium]